MNLDQIPDYIREDEELFTAYKGLLLARFKYEADVLKMKIVHTQKNFEETMKAPEKKKDFDIGTF